MKVFNRIASFASRRINHMNKQTATFYVPQKLMAQTNAIGSALHQTGNVRQHEAVLALLDDAEVGLQGGEVVVGNLGTGVGGDGEQGGFAHIGEAHKAHIR